MNGVFTQVDMGSLGSKFPDHPPSDARLGERDVVLDFGGESRALSFDWLRDNCPCGDCRIAQTDERRLQPWLYPAPICRSARVDDGAVAISWIDGHESRYEPTFWTEIRRSMQRNEYTATLWQKGHQLGRFQHDSVLTDADDRRRMFEAFIRDGAVVVTDSPTVPGTVVDFMRAIRLTLIDSALGFIFDVKLDPAGYNVAFTAEALPLHNDNAQSAHPPSGQVLAMLVNEASGGNSLVADGWSVLAQLQAVNPDAIEVLSSIDVGFRQYSTEADGFTRAPLVRRDAAGRFVHLRFSNQLLQPLPFDHPRLAEWYSAYRALGELIHRPENHISFRLNAGDMLLVNGYRVLHAREAFRPDGPRHLQDVYFCVDDVFSNVAQLMGNAVNAMVGS